MRINQRYDRVSIMVDDRQSNREQVRYYSFRVLILLWMANRRESMIKASQMLLDFINMIINHFEYREKICSNRFFVWPSQGVLITLNKSAIYVDPSFHIQLPSRILKHASTCSTPSIDRLTIHQEESLARKTHGSEELERCRQSSNIGQMVTGVNRYTDLK